MENCKDCKCELPMHRLGCPEAKGETALYAKIEQLQADNKEYKKHIKLLQDCDDSSTIVIGEMDEEIEQLETENKNLKEFTRHVIKTECWALYEQDGCELQELAEKLGLIEQHIATKDDVDDEFGDYEIGDIIYKFTEILKGKKQKL